MNITIRQAERDDAKAVAPLIYDAIGDIANNLTGEEEVSQILAALEQYVTETTNRHSYLNTFVAEQQGEIVGIVVLYDGRLGYKLDRRLEQQLAKKEYRLHWILKHIWMNIISIQFASQKMHADLALVRFFYNSPSKRARNLAMKKFL